MLGKFMAGAREAGAFARQALLLPRDTLAPVIPREVADGDHVVVFLHGLFASAGVLRPMRERVGRAALGGAGRLHTAALSFPPGPGVHALAARLGGLLSQLPDGCRVHLVGHSLGGIVARYHAVAQDDPRIVSTITLAAPFGGVRGAAMVGFGCALDLDPDSTILRTIRLASPARAIPHLSIIAGLDAFVSAPTSHALPSGDVLVLEGIGHNAVLFDPGAIAAVERRVLAVRSVTDRPAADAASG